jgi:tetratricopeptide (TPR) repeat protein
LAELRALAESDKQAIGYLRRVLELNPQYEPALNRLHQLLLNEGSRLAKAGESRRHAGLLMEASALNPNSEQAWLWLAQVAEKSSDVVRCLQKVLKLNPCNEQAINWLNQVFALQTNFTPLIPTWQCPICATSFQAELTTCLSCHAVLTLANVDELLANRETEREVLCNAIKHYQNITESLRISTAGFIRGWRICNCGDSGKA